ncbi:predicted protein [Heterostelium album PN500]|uniref:Core Histone H2A/H2B/H3 domain-containing protein n=1 Tax=Heterostelium pallidum (strain ATCC 26659 / Pp 5 / PN500) TaxID=670386 RepID=D3BNX2_HETP5|nr:predicted protein [Heterostelium album PN500]EFA76891.1 predicted protein [Heterostelium album PN500]|eukprot:XP_020429023.1 predicted protein [Heterostelium album PN500]
MNDSNYFQSNFDNASSSKKLHFNQSPTSSFGGSSSGSVNSGYGYSGHIPSSPNLSSSSSPIVDNNLFLHHQSSINQNYHQHQQLLNSIQQYSSSNNSIPPNSNLDTDRFLTIENFWKWINKEILQIQTPIRDHILPLARIKKIMKMDECVKMISADAPVIFAKACELFILELTIRSWFHTESHKRRTLQKTDISLAIATNETFDFLVDIVPREMREIPRRIYHGDNYNLLSNQIYSVDNNNQTVPSNNDQFNLLSPNSSNSNHSLSYFYQPTPSPLSYMENNSSEAGYSHHHSAGEKYSQDEHTNK